MCVIWVCVLCCSSVAGLVGDCGGSRRWHGGGGAGDAGAGDVAAGVAHCDSGVDGCGVIAVGVVGASVGGCSSGSMRCACCFACSAISSHC